MSLSPFSCPHFHELIATVESATPAPKVYYNHLDHLGGTAAVSTADGYLSQELAYYPFGAMRVDEQYGDLNQKNRYIGQEYDEETDLSYLNARYYEGTRGQFASQDPVFWEIGQSQNGIKALFDSQSQNSYSYARNNPIIYKDADGRYWESVFDAISFGLSVRDYQQNPSFGNGFFVTADGASLIFPVPALFGYLKHGNEARRIATYVHNSGMTRKQIVQFGVEFAKNSNFQFTSRAWSTGGALNDSAGSLVDHYVRHGDLVGASSVKDYYQKANQFIDSGKGVKMQAGNGYEIWDSKTSTLGVTDKSGNTIRSFYKVTDTSKIDSLNKKAKSLNQ